MKNYIHHFKEWYEYRKAREKILIVLLSFAMLYALFTIFLFNSLEKKEIALAKEIALNTEQIQRWKAQLAAINRIPSTTIYKEWIQHDRSLATLSKKYKRILQEAPNKQLEYFLKIILAPQPGISLVAIDHTEEQPYVNKLQGALVNKAIFEQGIHVTLAGNFFDIVNYLQMLENALPTLRWDSLTYEVTDYPSAKIQLEFAILYEKDK